MNDVFNLTNLNRRQEKMINLVLMEATEDWNTQAIFTRDIKDPLQIIKDFLTRKVIGGNWKVVFEIKMTRLGVAYTTKIIRSTKRDIAVIANHERQAWAMAAAMACGHRINFEDFA